MALLSSLSIGIACYNDIETIGDVIDESARTAERLAERFRILVVDDGSQDGSPARLQQLAAGRPWLECAFHATNQGFGATFGRLYQNVSCDYNAILAGDGQVPARELEVMAAQLPAYDV